ncbi:Spermine synthase [uncultured delta proteobacterium]|uniref:Spermine synthase n=1 Tax=uncultured delta proteobacterium TaxID=34034 RepID=A0A212JWT2_9DELT|nr:Spermine synthase [uncultured delta proteobacterium]
MLEIVSFICGAGVMVLEMAGARLLAPYLGTSIVVWTAMIGIVLASLSVGYWLGGKAGDKNPSARKLGLIIACGAAFVLLAALGQEPFLRTVASAQWSLQVSAVAAAVLLFAAPCVFLGMVSPYIIQVRLLDYKDKSRSSTVIGRFYALSTIGSIAGTFLGGYWLISWLGTRSILYGVAGVLAAAALIVMPRGRKMPAALVLGACMGLGGYAALSVQENLVTGIDRDTRYNHIRVAEGVQDGHRAVFMITDPGSAQSGMRLDDPNRLLFDYTRHYAIGWHIKPDAKKFLMLGGGGYSVPKYLLNAKKDATIDVVEIDPGITATAREFFALQDNDRMRIFHEDARVFLNRRAGLVTEGDTVAPYDVIMGDTFTSSYNIPFHLGTVECAGRIKALLRDDGVFVCNIISAVSGEQGKILRSIRAAFAEVFPQTHVFPVSMPGRPDVAQNVMLVALKTEKTIPLAWDADMQAMLAKEYKLPLEKDVVALTDDYAPVERYAMPMLEARN